MSMSYRQYLQYHANNHPSSTKRAEAQALLNVVGDDQRINGNFLTGERHGLFGARTREQQSNGYTASTINRSVNPWWRNSYGSYINKNNIAKVGHKTDSSDRSVGFSRGYGGGGGGSRASAAQLAEYQQGIDQANHNLGRVNTQLGIRRANINDSWKKKSDALASSIDRAKHQYDDQVIQNKQQRRNDVNLINDRASGDLRGLLSVLGARGANGSDIDKVARAVQDKATRERSGSGSAYAKNAQELDTNWQNFNQEAEKERKELNDWKVNEERGAEREAETQRQGLHTLLAQLRSQQAEARGQNGANAARADLNRSRELSGKIDSLARIQTTHTGKDVIYKPKSLDSYKIEGDTEVKVGDSSGLSGDQAANVYDTKRSEEERKKKNQYV